MVVDLVQPWQMTPIPAARCLTATHRPTVAVDYNKSMGHVDQVDQLRPYYVVQRRGRRMWPALAWWLLNMCINNAYKLLCVETNSKLSVMHFREQLRQIAERYPSPRTHVQPGIPASVPRAPIGHYSKHTHKTRRCAHCTRVGPEGEGVSLCAMWAECICALIPALGCIMKGSSRAVE